MKRKPSKRLRNNERTHPYVIALLRGFPCFFCIIKCTYLAKLLTLKKVLIMKTKKYIKIGLFYAGIVIFGFSSFDAIAQTANMTADVTVQNTLTIATPTQLNFGTIAAIRDAAQTASVSIDTAGAGTVASAGGVAATAIVDATAISAGQITVADGADGATLNIVINNVVDPVNGTESFVLDGFTTSWNNGADSLQVIGAAFTETFDAAFGGGTNQMDIGATITTTLAAGTAYTDGAYAGTYDVVFSY